MLGTGDRLKILRVIALHGPNRLHRKRLNKQRVLAEVFLATSPSRIPQPHIDRRRGKEGKAISRLIMIGAGLVGYGKCRPDEPGPDSRYTPGLWAEETM